jgi:hypothetical protein
MPPGLAFHAVNVPMTETGTLLTQTGTLPTG